MRFAIGMALVGLLFGGACGGARGAGDAPAGRGVGEASAGRGVGEALPPVEARLLDGSTWRAEQARGSVLVIDVWASWCKPCRKGFPILNDLAGRHAGVAFVAISIDEEEDAVQAFLQQVPVQVPVARDPDGAVTRPPLAIERVPAVIVVDREGVVRLRLEEPDQAGYAEVERIVAELAAR